MVATKTTEIISRESFAEQSKNKNKKNKDAQIWLFPQGINSIISIRKILSTYFRN